MPDILVGLVQLGFLGFAVAIMYLAYNLLQELVRSPSQNVQTLRLRILAVGMFLALSSGVLGLGIWWSFTNPDREVAITIDLLPEADDIYAGISFRRPGESFVWTGQKTLNVKHEDHLTLDMFRLMTRMSALERKLAGLEEQQRNVLDSTLNSPTELTEASDEQGI